MRAFSPSVIKLSASGIKEGVFEDTATSALLRQASVPRGPPSGGCTAPRALDQSVTFFGC